MSKLIKKITAFLLSALIVTGASAVPMQAFAAENRASDIQYVSETETESNFETTSLDIAIPVEPEIPVITSLECVEDGIKISWNAVEDVYGYRLYYKTSAGEWRRFKDTTDTSYVDKGVAPGRTETYTIRTLDANGEPNSGYDKNGWSLTFQGASPQITSLYNDNSGVVIKWNAVKGVSKYKVFFKNSKGNWTSLATTGSTSFTDKKVSSGRMETYTVRGVNANGDYITSYDKTGRSITYIATPSVKEIKNAENGIKLSWSPVNGAYGYRVFYKNSKGGWTGMANVTSPSYLDSVVKSGSSYVYTVRCIDKDGKFISGYNGNGWKAKFVATPQVTEIRSDTDGVYIKWNAVKGASKYRVFFYGKNGWTRVGTTSSNSFVDKVVSSGTTYRYTVRCVDDNDNYVSDYNSKGWNVKYIATPKITVKSKLGGVKISWNSVKGAEKYRVFYKNRNGNWVRLGDTTSTGFLDKKVNSGSSYTYTVRCVSADGKKYTSYYNTSGKSIKYENPEKYFNQKEKEAAEVAKDIISTIPQDVSDFEKIKYASATVCLFCSCCEYTTEGVDYCQPYGVFVKGEFSCAGSTRALGLLLDYMGYDWEHINENQWTHQWCELYLDGKKVWADGMAGLCGYGEYPEVIYSDDYGEDYDKYFLNYVNVKQGLI